MKLNSDCVRDILLMVEENTDFLNVVEYRKSVNIHDNISKYTHEEIIYHIKQCEMSGLIDEVLYCNDGDFVTISDLTPKGHEFLANVRQEKIWNGIKSIAKKVGSTSLSALVQISSNVIAEIIKAQFGIGGNPLIP